MASNQVVVKLTPVYSPDTLPFRSLTFCSDNDTMPIGRASKSETKHLVPEHDNGWFESRVMSREHAVMSVNLEDKSVFIRDHGSLHGTHLNDSRIPSKQNVAVKSGDVLMFGCEISRGTQTFRPISVRLDCDWHEDLINPIQTKSNTNTFSVPDEEDDDVVEVVAAKASQWSSDSSDAGDSSDRSHPLDLTSPATSPAMHASQLPKPQSFVVDDDHEYKIQQTSVLVDSDDDDDKDESELDDANVMDDGVSVHSLDSHDSIIKAIDNASAEALLECANDPVLRENIAELNLAIDNADKALDKAREALKVNPPKFTEVSSQLPSQINPNDKGKCPISPSELLQSSKNQGLAWRRAAEESSSRLLNFTTAFSPCGLASQNSDVVLPAIQAWANNTRLPSDTAAVQNATNLTRSVGSNSANESFPFGPHRSSGYLSHVVDRNSGNGLPAWLEPANWDDSTNTDCEAKSKAEPTVVSPPSRVSVSGIVEAVTRSGSSATEHLKRKANASLDDQDEAVKLSMESQDSITDAQPRTDLQNFEVSQPPTNDTQLVAQSIPARQRKRVKTSHSSSWMKYAAVAAVGAVVGSIGTIAGLSSLPTDYFI